MGGVGMYLGKDVGWPNRESSADFIRVLAEFVDLVVCRMKSHQSVEELASFDCVPVINGLTDRAHPCQALGDLMTLQELQPNLAGKTLVFVGDGNNVSQSLALACAMLGVRFRLLGPKEYEIEDSIVKQILGKYPGADFDQGTDPRKMLPSADFVYTDVWTSMGQESESDERIQAFSAYQVNSKLMSLAPTHCKVLHCLPARRGQEITDEVIDSPNSKVVSQAGNRMHAQKGLLLWMALQHQKLSPETLKRDGISLPAR
jgi:ornithine carbamoyltransferase